MGLYGLLSVFLLELIMDGSVWICICVSHCICYEWVGTDSYLCFSLYLLWMDLHGFVSVSHISFVMNGFVWVSISVSQWICYGWVCMDLYLCFALYLLWMGWYGSARRLVARSCSQVVPQLPHRGCPNTDSHRSQVDKSSKLFPVCVSQHPVCYLLGVKLSTSVVRSCLISWRKTTLCGVIYVDMMWRRIHWKGCSEAIVHYQLQFLAFHLTRLIVCGSTSKYCHWHH